MFRKTIFWIHLICGVTTGLVIVMMSVTGVILTYERQMIAWANRDLHAPPEPGAVREPIEALVAAVKLSEPDFNATSVTIPAEAGAPASVGAGRSGARYVHPYTAEVLGEGAVGLERFFGAMTGWHRWFNKSADSRGPWRAVTGASNLAFLFLILSGLYLWLPRVFAWAMFKTRLLFNLNPGSGKARDFNWHHVIGIWTAIPLAVVVATAVVFSYSWANDLVYRSFGEEPPAGRGRGAPASAVGSGIATGLPLVKARSLDELFGVAAGHSSDWRAITMQWPGPHDTEVRFSIDQGNGGQPQLRHNLTLDAHSGEVVAWEPFESQTPGRRARSWVRFLHTGEALGLVGQTIAGLVSLTSILMVWTGVALAYRRLIVPLLGRR